jgi:hypothetical protein
VQNLMDPKAKNIRNLLYENIWKKDSVYFILSFFKVQLQLTCVWWINSCKKIIPWVIFY